MVFRFVDDNGEAFEDGIVRFGASFVDDGGGLSENGATGVGAARIVLLEPTQAVYGIPPASPTVELAQAMTLWSKSVSVYWYFAVFATGVGAGVIEGILV